MNLKVEHLDFYFGRRQILQDVCFEAHGGEFLSILGPNGVGKSTLFRCILNLLSPSAGNIMIDDRDVRQMKVQELAQRIAYIPQFHNPAFNYSVQDMVLMGTASQLGALATPGKAQIETAQNAMARMKIEHLAEQPYGFCSGGEKQLCLIARAIAQQAKILVMDEPSSNLDFGNRIWVMQTVRSLVADGYAVIQTTHDPEQAFMYSDKIMAMHDGRVLAWGTPQEIMQPELMSTLYGIDVEVHSLNSDKVRVCVPVDSPCSDFRA